MPGSDQRAESKGSLVGRVVLGRYRVMRQLAQGGMGVVYLGRVEGSAGFAKPVVIKTVLAESAGREGEKLFAREARIVSNLQHPGIVAVIDFGEVDSSHVMVLEYVHGHHLGQWARFVAETRGSLPLPLALHPVLAVLDALAFAHGLARPDGTPFGIVHRDVTPANALIDVQGHVKLGDFGIARTADDEYKTKDGLFKGTLPFAAPEVLQGEAATAKVDQYAAAVVLYQLLAGKNPFRGQDSMETLGRVLNHVPPPLASLRDDVPAAIDAAIARALSKEPEQRFESVSEFARALRAGRTWPAHEEAEAFAARIREDFAGDALSERLGVESLSVRDKAWRDAQEDTGDLVGLSSSPPGISERAPAGPVARAGVDSDIETVREPLAARAGADRKRPVGLWLGVAGLALVAAAAVAFALGSRGAQGGEAKVVVVEKQEALDEPQAPVAPVRPDEVASAPAPASAPPLPSLAPAPKRSPSTSPGPAPADRGATLARAFQRQQSQIQSCFRQHSANVEGDPGISVKFQIDESGAVQRAQVSPSSVAQTPLGPCLVAVARATQFGPQPEPVSFAIPISARVVRR